MTVAFPSSTTSKSVRAALVVPLEAALKAVATAAGGIVVGVLLIAGGLSSFGVKAVLVGVAATLVVGLAIAAVMLPPRLRALSLAGPKIVVAEGVVEIPGHGRFLLEEHTVEALAIEPERLGRRTSLVSSAVLFLTRRGETEPCMIIGANWEAPPTWKRNRDGVHHLAAQQIPAVDVIPEHFPALVRAMQRSTA